MNKRRGGNGRHRKRPRSKLRPRVRNPPRKTPRKTAQAQPPAVTRAPHVDDTPPLRAQDMFAGPRPASMSRGIDPAFLLFERELLERIQVRAAELGVRYQSLVQQIVRDHVDEY